ncbi:MAG: YtxH domain-containing protein [Negativicutes bacterium]|nr:YtxH domain-containing protein [Negativicutes bacterium]
MSFVNWIEKRKRTCKKRERNIVLRNVVMGAAVGVTAGVAAGILLAPKPGEQARKDIAAAVMALPEKARDLLERGRGKLEEFKDKLKEKKAKRAKEASQA